MTSHDVNPRIFGCLPFSTPPCHSRLLACTFSSYVSVVRGSVRQRGISFDVVTYERREHVAYVKDTIVVSIRARAWKLPHAARFPLSLSLCVYNRNFSPCISFREGCMIAFGSWCDGFSDPQLRPRDAEPFQNARRRTVSERMKFIGCKFPFNCYINTTQCRCASIN